MFTTERKPPTLIVWGKNDKIFPPVGALIKRTSRDLPDAELHLLRHRTLRARRQSRRQMVPPDSCDFLDRKVAARYHVDNGLPVLARWCFTPAIKATTERYGSRRQYAKLRELPAKGATRSAPRSQEFLGERDSFYMASVGAGGWPYIQHRGGPKGFLKVHRRAHDRVRRFSRQQAVHPLHGERVTTDDRVALIRRRLSGACPLSSFSWPRPALRRGAGRRMDRAHRRFAIRRDHRAGL